MNDKRQGNEKGRLRCTGKHENRGAIKRTRVLLIKKSKLIYIRSKKYILFLHPIPVYYPRITLALPPSSNSGPGSHSGPSSPLPTTARALIFFARIIHHFLPSSTRVELFRKMTKIGSRYTELCVKRTPLRGDRNPARVNVSVSYKGVPSLLSEGNKKFGDD